MRALSLLILFNLPVALASDPIFLKPTLNGFTELSLRTTFEVRPFAPIEHKVISWEASLNTTKSEGLTVFNYEVPKPKVEKLSKISRKVTDVISREMAAPIKRIQKKLREEKRPRPVKGYSTRLNFYPVFNQKKQKIHSVDVLNRHNSDKRYHSQSEDFVQINFSSEKEAFVQFDILQSNMVKTIASLAITSDREEIEVPLFSIDGFTDFLNAKEANGPGSFILVQIDNYGKDAELLGPHDKRFYFDKNFNEVDNSSGAHFVLFTGVQEGLNLIKLEDIKNEHHLKIAFAENDLIYFTSFHLEPETKGLELFLKKKHLLATEGAPYELEEGKLKVNENVFVFDKVHSNFFKAKQFFSVIGLKNYVELHDVLSNTVMFSVAKSREVEVPAFDFISEIYRLFELDGLGKYCLIQLNFKKSPHKMNFSAFTSGRGVNLDAIYLGRNGLIGEKISSKTKYAFFLGYERAVVNGEIEYLDKSTENITSYCLPGNHLIEAL